MDQTTFSGRTLLAAALITLASGCAVRHIPGTQIEDNDENRAILEVMKRFREAVEERDAQKVINLLADSFKDDVGTPSPEDDLDYQSIRERLPQDMAKLDEVRLDMSVRKIEISRAENTARAVYTYTSSYRMPTFSARPKTDEEIKEMWFKRVGGEWKITSGI
ncbi:MAG: DUF4440 domain-containing protein [Myxococcales bacterium]|nr:DUF4440 domain-containing protein [Myxococcales bacterium]